jgi:hypothetical protein
MQNMQKFINAKLGSSIFDQGLKHTIEKTIITVEHLLHKVELSRHVAYTRLF